MLAVVSSCVISPLSFRRDMQRLRKIDLVGGHQPGPDAAAGVPILALRHVEFAVPHPVADGALVAQRRARHIVERAARARCGGRRGRSPARSRLRNRAARDPRPHDRLLMADQRAGRAVEHAGIFRRLGLAVVGIAVGVIDADAEDLLRRQAPAAEIPPRATGNRRARPAQPRARRRARRAHRSRTLVNCGASRVLRSTTPSPTSPPRRSCPARAP